MNLFEFWIYKTLGIIAANDGGLWLSASFRPLNSTLISGDEERLKRDKKLWGREWKEKNWYGHFVENFNPTCRLQFSLCGQCRSECIQPLRASFTICAKVTMCPNRTTTPSNFALKGWRQHHSKEPFRKYFPTNGSATATLNGSRYFEFLRSFFFFSNIHLRINNWIESQAPLCKDRRCTGTGIPEGGARFFPNEKIRPAKIIIEIRYESSKHFCSKYWNVEYCWDKELCKYFFTQKMFPNQLT